MGQAELELIIIQVPLGDGTFSEGTLWEFYESINSGETDLSDDGFILSDESLLPTNGQPYVGVTPEDLYSLMSAYIIEDGNIVEEEEDTTIVPEDNGNKSLIKLVLMGLIIYAIVK